MNGPVASDLFQEADERLPWDKLHAENQPKEANTNKRRKHKSGRQVRHLENQATNKHKKTPIANHTETEEAAAPALPSNTTNIGKTYLPPEGEIARAFNKNGVIYTRVPRGAKPASMEDAVIGGAPQTDLKRLFDSLSDSPPPARGVGNTTRE